jgi:hypothetical protein
VKLRLAKYSFSPAAVQARTGFQSGLASHSALGGCGGSGGGSGGGDGGLRMARAHA